MTVYVDDAIHSWKGKMWCHLFADSLPELHAFAGDFLDLHRCWFQKPPKASWAHYDITARRRALALRFGAIDAGRHTPLKWKASEIAHIQGGGTLESWTAYHTARMARIDAARAAFQEGLKQ